MSPQIIHMLSSIILFLRLSLICAATSVLLTPKHNPSENGASIHEWDLYSTDNRGYNMKIHLDKSWSFNSQHTTTLSLQITGNTFPDTSNTSLIVSFSQNNVKYITSVLQMTDTSTDNLIYDPPTHSKQSYGTGNIEELLSTSDILSNDNNNGYMPYIVSPNLSYPLTFTLQNHPTSDFLIFTYSNPSILPIHIMYYGMDTTQPLDIYFSDIDNNFEITSFNITHSIIGLNTINNFETTFTNFEEIKSIDWFKTSLVIILVSTIFILCCLCCLFCVMFTKMLKNHKKMIEEKHAKTVNANQTSQVCKSDTNPHQTEVNINGNAESISKSELNPKSKSDTVTSTMSDIISTTSTNKSKNIELDSNNGINIIYKRRSRTFTRDRLNSDGENQVCDEKKEEEKKETDEDDIEDMYIKSKQITPGGPTVSNGEIDTKHVQESDTDSDEIQDTFAIPIREDIERIANQHQYNVSAISGLSGIAVVNLENNLSTPNLKLNLLDINSAVSVAEGTTSPYASPSLQFGSPTNDSSMTTSPYASPSLQFGSPTNDSSMTMTPYAITDKYEKYPLNV